MQPKQSKLSTLKTRAISTVVLIGSFVAINYLGHVPLMAMIFGIQVFRGSDRHSIWNAVACPLSYSCRWSSILTYIIICNSILWSGSYSSWQASLRSFDQIEGLSQLRAHRSSGISFL